MPCYQVRLTSVEFSVKFKGFLEEAMRRLQMGEVSRGENTYFVHRYRMRIDLDAQKVVMPEGKIFQDKLNELKREYSKVCLEEVAKKKKWRLKQTSANQFQAVRL